MSFSSESELNDFLRKETPLYISYSVGYFEFPDATPMEAKRLLGSDLIFEFDVDELGIDSPLDVVVDGKPVLFPDPEREERLKEEVETLVKDFLVGDLGIRRPDILINFSGNRGYHIHVRSEELRHLDRDARVEIVEYVTGQSIDPRILFDTQSVAMGKILGPRPSDPGWPGRIARYVMEKYPQYAESIKRGRWPVLYSGPEGVLRSISFWVDVARRASPYMGKTIDVNTSVDIHRLIRLPGSLHGGTGLAAMPVKNLQRFYPYRDAVVLGERPYLTLHVDICPEFELKGETFGPYRNQKVELPLFASIFLLGKGVARWISTTSG